MQLLLFFKALKTEFLIFFAQKLNKNNFYRLNYILYIFNYQGLPISIHNLIKGGISKNL